MIYPHIYHSPYGLSLGLYSADAPHSFKFALVVSNLQRHSSSSAMDKDKEDKIEWIARLFSKSPLTGNKKFQFSKNISDARLTFSGIRKEISAPRPEISEARPIFSDARPTFSNSKNNFLHPVQKIRIPVQFFRIPVQKFRIPVQLFRISGNKFLHPVLKFRMPVQKFRVPVRFFGIWEKKFLHPVQLFLNAGLAFLHAAIVPLSLFNHLFITKIKTTWQVKI